MYAARAAIESDPLICNDHVSQCVDHVNCGGSKKLPVQTRWPAARVPQAKLPGYGYPCHGRDPPEGTPLVKPGDSSRYGPLTETSRRARPTAAPRRTSESLHSRRVSPAWLDDRCLST